MVKLVLITLPNFKNLIILTMDFTELMKIKSYFFIKRLFDIVFSFLLMIMLSWLYIVIALVILISSGYPIFYADKRVGKNGKTISVFKFRTMINNAQDNIKNLLTPEEYNTWEREHKLNNDPRVTKVGRILRKLSMDELPQLLNIFFGSMSFVGPRPITFLELNKYFNQKEKEKLLSVKPGLISLWSVYGRSDVLFSDGKRQAIELEYFNHCNLWFDFKLIIKVIPNVILCKGAR